MGPACLLVWGRCKWWCHPPTGDRVSPLPLPPLLGRLQGSGPATVKPHLAHKETGPRKGGDGRWPLPHQLRQSWGSSLPGPHSRFALQCHHGSHASGHTALCPGAGVSQAGPLGWSGDSTLGSRSDWGQLPESFIPGPRLQEWGLPRKFQSRWVWEWPRGVRSRNTDKVLWSHHVWSAVIG